MSRRRAEGECLVCGHPDLYAKGLCRPDYMRRRRGLPDLTEEERIRRNYELWARSLERDRMSLILRRVS